MRKYTKEHQWIELQQDGTAKVGITQYAANELGEITFIELPAMDKCVHGGEPLCVVESVKAASDVFMPVTGTVAAVNSPLEKNPAPLNDDPEGEGWICLLKDPDANALDSLLSREQYDDFCQ